MCIPPRIPLPVTILYVVTVTNLVILLNLTLVDANVRVLNRLNQTIVDSIMDLPAKFGKPVPDEGIWGHLIYAEPRDACSEIKPPPKITSNESGIPNKWIALVRRSNCNFDMKVIEAQRQGYVAVIVHNIGSDKLVTMRGSGNQSKVVIPSIFIGYQDAEYLYEKCNDDIHYTIVIDTQSPIIDPNTAKLIFSIFGIVIGSCFLTMIAFAVVKWIRDYRRRNRSRLSKANLKQLPVQKFKKGDVYDICAICLEEYEEGEKLRILPCNHAYHQKCIDPWLLKNKKTCPICKRKVMPGRNDSDSESDSDDQTENEGASEREPLLSAGRLPGTRGNTFNNTGIPERLLHEYNFTSSDEDDDSSLEDSLRPVTSHCQSSVEVHSEPDYRTAQAMRPPRRIGGLTARYAMFNESSNDANPVNPSNQPDEAQATAAPSSKKPATKPKENRAWEYGLSPPKVNHFSIYDETQNIVEEEEPVAIEISPTGSQEEEVQTSSSGRQSRTEGAGGARKKKIKKSSPQSEKSSGGSPRDDGEERESRVADEDVETGSATPGTKRKSAKKHKSSAGVPSEAGTSQKTPGKRVSPTGGVISQKTPGKRVSPTGGVISPMDDGNNGVSGTETHENAVGGSNGPRLVDVGEMEKSSGGLNIQTDNVLGVHGAVGGMDEDHLLEQPIVEVVGSGRHKSKKKKTTKKKR